MNKYEKFMNDADIVDEPMALREVHAIRLLIHDETKDMTPEERVRHINEQGKKIAEKYGISIVKSASTSLDSSKMAL